uniref:Uncharacterized protein n=2 Tax=Biomphalaria glabrata TaxID=6526 RepID=A0A2C9JV33_BIOGL
MYTFIVQYWLVLEVEERAAKNNQLKEKGFDTSPYGISKIGVSLITHIQQKQLDESGAQDIVVNCVTGANKGLGFGIVRGLCKAFEGDVFLTARDEGRGRAAVAELEKEDLHPKFHLLDISDHDSIVKLKDFLQSNYGGLDLLVNNAAIAYEFNSVPSPPIGQAAEEVCKINYFGTLDVCQTLFPLLRPHARVCNVSSINCEFSLAECGEELKARIRNPDLTIDDVTALCDVGLVSTDMTGGAGMPIDLGAMTPLYCCLLPPDVESPRGKFIMNKRTYDWLNN